MTPDSDELLTGWTFGFAEDIDLPGWVPLPSALTADEEELFVSEVSSQLQTLMAETRPGAPPPSEDELARLVHAGLAARAASESALMYQVWPVAGPAFLLCHVNLIRTSDLPDWAELPGTVFPAEARYIGPGLQYSARRVIDDNDGKPVEVSAIHLVFGDDDFGVMIGLDESASALISQALEGLSFFTNALVLTRGDGTTFTSIAPSRTVADDEWFASEDRTT